MASELKYKTPRALKNAIDCYFKECESRERTIVTKQGEKIDIPNPMMPTVTGLALHLGTNRQTLINYSERAVYADVIMMAKARIEAATEQGLFDKETYKGSQFSLSNNFDWAEKKDVKSEGSVTVQSVSYAGASRPKVDVKTKKPASKPKAKPRAKKLAS